MKKTNILFLFLLSLVITCCNDDNSNSPSVCQDFLPADTKTGANTFGCCINGNLLIPRSGTGTFGGSDFALSPIGDPSGNSQYAEFDVRDFKSERTAKILIHIQNLEQIGVADYTINESNGYDSIDGLDHTYLHCRVFNDATNSYQYYRSFENSGLLKITRFDFANRIVSGTFSCRVKNSADPNDIIEIKDGRFDINTHTVLNVIFP